MVVVVRMLCQKTGRGTETDLEYITGESIMENMKNAVMRFVRDEEGAGVIEYSLIAGIMAAIIITALHKGVGTAITNVFAKITLDLGKFK